MSGFPSDEELLRKYAPFLDNAEIDAVSFWKEKNHDEVISDEEHLARMTNNLDSLQDKMEEGLNSLKGC